MGIHAKSTLLGALVGFLLGQAINPVVYRSLSSRSSCVENYKETGASDLQKSSVRSNAGKSSLQVMVEPAKGGSNASLATEKQPRDSTPVSPDAPRPGTHGLTPALLDLMKSDSISESPASSTDGKFELLEMQTQNHHSMPVLRGEEGTAAGAATSQRPESASSYRLKKEEVKATDAGALSQDGSSPDKTRRENDSNLLQPPVPRLLEENETDPWKIEHYGRLDRIREKCGGLCSINSLSAYQSKGNHTPGNAYSTFTAPVNCTSLFEMEELDAADLTVPYPVPEELVDWYSLHGAIELNNHFAGKMNNVQNETRTVIWTRERIEQDLKLLKEGKLKGTYTVEATNGVLDKFKRFMQNKGIQSMKGKSVLILGSLRPWLEVIALHVGAKHVTTLEYAPIVSQHPKIVTFTPNKFREAYRKGKLPRYDLVFSYSSLEHSGLGRYGDALNPWGDILSLARCWCVTKKNGYLMLGVPMRRDTVQFNAHRAYGNLRISLLTTNWIPVDGTQDFQKGISRTNFHSIHFFQKVIPETAVE